MIPTIRSAFVASAPSQRPQMQRLVGVDDSLRDEDEDGAGEDADSGALRSVPGPLMMRPRLAPSINPAARLFAVPSQLRPDDWLKKNGSAPRPVANAVSSATTENGEGVHRLPNVTSPEEAAGA